MNESIYVGRTSEGWKEHNLRELYLFSKGEPTRFKAIEKNGKVVSIVGDRYKLLPNEYVRGIADETATLVGAVPFNEFTGEWYVRLQDHVFLTGHNKAQIHALYAFNEPVEIEKGDSIQLGFAVHNSIDGSLGLSIGCFTFRHACANMVFMGVKGQGMQFDDREVLASVYQRHTKNMVADSDSLRKAMLGVIDQSRQIVANYRAMTKVDLDLQIAKKLVRNLPDKYLPEYIDVDDKRKVSLIKAPRLWETYNDLTAAIWHNDKTDYAAKTDMFKKLHKAIAIPVKG